MLGLRRNNEREVEGRLRALKSDFETLQRDVVKLAEGVGGVARKHASGFLEDSEAWTDDNLGNVREAIRDQPLAAGLILLGAGAILGALLLRR